MTLCSKYVLNFLHRRMMLAQFTSQRIVWRCFRLNGSQGALWPSCPLVATYSGFAGIQIPICGSPAWTCLCGHTVFANWICLICQYREQWSQVERYRRKYFLSALYLSPKKYILLDAQHWNMLIIHMACEMLERNSTKFQLKILNFTNRSWVEARSRSDQECTIERGHKIRYILGIQSHGWQNTLVYI